jgi:2-haloacid dehalogenase
MAERFPDLKVLAFDVFGTVLDWRGGISSELTAIARQRQLQVDAPAFADAWRRRAQELWAAVYRRETPYAVLDELHAQALDELAGRFGLSSLDHSDRQRLVLAWHRLPAWPEVLRAMTRLHQRYVLTTLSNGGIAHLVDTARSAKLPFDCILSTELLKTYKPDPRVYQLVPTLLRVSPEQAMMVASHPYDLSAAAGQGLRTAFIRRPQEWGTGKVEHAPDFPVDIDAADFNELASQLLD